MILSVNTVIVSLHSINQQFFLMEMNFIFYEVGIDFLNVT